MQLGMFSGLRRRRRRRRRCRRCCVFLPLAPCEAACCAARWNAAPLRQEEAGRGLPLTRRAEARGGSALAGPGLSPPRQRQKKILDSRAPEGAARHLKLHKTVVWPGAEISK